MNIYEIARKRTVEKFVESNSVDVNVVHNREARYRYETEYRHTHRDEINARKRRWYAENRERITAQQRSRYVKKKNGTRIH